jgi:hypothetical protein
MKQIIIFIFYCFITFLSHAQNRSIHNKDKNKKVQVVETACGQCKFGMEGKSCDLAVRINGEAYFVDGTKIDDHGDAHAKEGFCNAIRKAEVQGEVVNNRFQATYFSLLPPSSKKQKTKKGV